MVLLAAMSCLTGCASITGVGAAIRDPWQGATYDDVVARWGAPVRSRSLDDSRLACTWHTDGVASRASVWPSIGIGGGSGMGVGIGIGVTAGASRDVAVSCERTLIFRDGRVAEQTWRGPADFCGEFRRQ